MNRYDYDNWFVYELIDTRPAANRAVFYIGKTATPRARLSDHKRNPESAAHQRITDIRADGYEVEMYCIGRFNTEEEALDYEGYLIKKTPGLVNRLGYCHPTDEFTRPVVDIPDLEYVTTEAQPIPDDETVIDAIAAQLPHVPRNHICAVVRAQHVLFSEDFEYAGVTDE